MSDNMKQPTLPLSFWKIEAEHLPGQTERFVKALTAFIADQEDPTGLKVYNLTEMAKNLHTAYERIESMLKSLDNSEGSKMQ